MKNISTNGTVWNPYSWNEEANIFFLDQPVGVGFSYADFGETVETTEAAAKNVHAFLSIFFETFKQFSGRALHLSGESYGGRYLPVFASEIYDQNQITIREGRQTLNLQSVLIGNGVTDISTLRILFQPCEGVLCYAENAAIKRFLDLPETRAMLGVDQFPTSFSACSSDVAKNFVSHMDKWAVPTQHYVSGLLNRGIRVLIYAGTYDWQCNWVSNKLWVEKLEWSGSSEYQAQEWRDWIVGGKKVGEVRETRLLTFATIRGAGHMMTGGSLGDGAEMAQWDIVIAMRGSSAALTYVITDSGLRELLRHM
ncbi:hypothetical protein H0H81_011078 [Sphagnurus paluster]|uniref:Carboxypeptidase n=1 Tax=Sphagnurus paluster TaxID=117069 RepID=A0A9P7GK65_9AGAR|nr:hypothetical protein H0H81_011078 [Sphagnurus paluster]